MGTVTVDVSRYDVTTHEYRLAPLRSVMMRGSAVPTTVWSSEARNIVRRIAPRIASFRRGGRVASEFVLIMGSGMPRKTIARRRFDDVDAALERDASAVEHQVVVAWVVPSARARIEGLDVS